MKDFSQMTDDELDDAIIQKSSAQPQEMDYSTLSDDDLDEMIIQKQASEVPQDRPGEAFVQNFGNAAAMGYLPQIQAATEPIIQGVADFFSGDDTDEKLKAQGFKFNEAPKETYVQRRDKSINELNQLSEENPYSSMAGGASGAIVSGIATGGGLNKLIGSAGKVATWGQRAKQAAGSGAVVGAIRNPGDTEGEVSPLQLKERASNAAQDAATGLVVQGGLEGIKKVATGAKNAGKNLKYWSQNKAFKAVGADKPAFKKAILNKKNTELGQAALDNDLIQGGDDIKDIAKNTEKALSESGDKIGKIYDKLDNGPSLSIKKEDIKNIGDEYMSEAANRLDGTVDGEEIAKKLNGVLETMPKNATFGELRKWRSSIDNKINYSKANNDLPEFQAELLKLRSKVQEKIGEAIGKVNPEMKKQFLKENKNYGNLSEIKRISNLKAAGTEGNTSFGMREGFGGTIGSIIGASVAGPVGAGAGAVIGSVTTNFARKHATPFVAMTANKVARALEKNSNAIGKFSKPLIDSASSPEKFVASINLMMKDPEFKKSMKNMNSETIYRGPAKGKK